MSFFGATGFVLTVLGIAGLDGAIYFGTGYLTSGALLAMGAAGLYIDYRRGRPGKGGKAVMGYKTCPYCGAHLDPEEACDCGEEDLAVPQETKEPAGGRRTGSEKETL